ncbi:DUF4880 domain-containing protein [Sphingomonas sp. ASV193]|uniref:FecR family protein n=1 Tax=Sphingomonas sp. ASV193 TaxID=3144405 RepID=UPI0032E8BBB1
MINPFSKDERVRRQAARWFARLQGPSTEEDRARFDEWRARDPANAAAFARMASLWQASAGVRLPSPSLPRVAPMPHRLAWATGFALILAIGGCLLVGVAPPFVSTGRAQDLTVATGRGEIRTVKLADGSSLTLDSQSAARISIDRRDRRIRLDRGRARIAWVAEQRPLTLDVGETIELAGAGTIDLSTNGRAYLLQTGAGAVVMTLGSVRRALGPNAALQIPPGVSAEGGNVVSDPDWPDGYLDFRNELLGSVLDRANRYAETPIELGDPALAKLRITGRYRAGDTRGLAAGVAAAFDLAAVYSDGRIRLDPKTGRGQKKNGG